HRETEARPAILGREERIEEPLRILGIDAAAGVAHLDDDVARAPSWRSEGGGRCGPLHPEAEAAAVGAHGLERVADEVDDRAVERLLVGGDRRHVPRVLTHPPA